MFATLLLALWLGSGSAPSAQSEVTLPVPGARALLMLDEATTHGTRLVPAAVDPGSRAVLVPGTQPRRTSDRPQLSDFDRIDVPPHARVGRGESIMSTHVAHPARLERAPASHPGWNTTAGSHVGAAALPSDAVADALVAPTPFARRRTALEGQIALRLDGDPDTPDFVVKDGVAGAVWLIVSR